MLENSHHHTLEKARAILKHSRSLFVLTGAGISAESGIPTFRGKDGLWKSYSAMDLATPEAFQKDPVLVWEWYHWRQEIIRNARPNPAHTALVALEKHIPSFMLLTQNVDNLHQRAGSMNVLELHGNIFRTRCLECSGTCMIGTEDIKQKVPLPVCSCGGILRPDVVWFGEMIPQDIWQNALTFLAHADTALICGTSGIVWPAAAIPEYAQQHNVHTIELNIEKTPISSIVEIFLEGKAGELLPDIVNSL